MTTAEPIDRAGRRGKRAVRGEVDLARLGLAIYQSRMALRRPREERREAVRQLVGSHYSDEGAGETVPVNFVSLFCKVIGPKLIAKSPRVMLSTFDPKAKPAVAMCEAWANKKILDLGVADTLQRVVLDAFFCVGIARVALGTPMDASQAGWNLRAGEPFVDRVSLDDFFFDVHCQDLSEAGFVGHRVRVLREVAEDFLRAKLPASEDRYYNPEGDERTSVIGRTFYGSQVEEFAEFVDLYEVYVPHLRRVLILRADAADGGGYGADGGKPLHEQEWLGPDAGPYHYLGFQLVPDNPLPKGPVQDVLDLHLPANHIYRKLIRQAQRQKSLTLVRSSASEDGARVLSADDGEMPKVDHPDDFQQIDFGGPNPKNFAMGQHLKELVSWFSGNLDIVGGLSPQSKTAAQDEMLQQNSGALMGDLQERTVIFTSAALKGLMWYWWHHPTLTMDSVWSPPGVPQVQVRRSLGPEKRRLTKWADLDVRVDPYSMQHSTPMQQAAAIDQTMTQIVIPLAPVLAQQGVYADMAAYLKMRAKLLNIPGLDEIVHMTEPPPPAESGGGGGPAGGAAMPGSTTRNYTRRSVGADSTASRNAEATATLMSQGDADNG